MVPANESLEQLLENASWVRALGVELVGSGEADDLVQDAYVVALERPGAALAPAAWLSGVLRRLAGRRRRGTERRERRERAAARQESQPGADELVAEAELQRALIAAVTALDEPYRSTVLLRFYRGWTPDEIARSLGVPGATVRTRLARALARLRERLDREHGGRDAWAALFVAPGGGWFTGGGVLMGAKATVAGAAALTAASGWWLWQGRAEIEDGPARGVQGALAAGEAAPAGAVRLPPEAAPASGAAREALDSATKGPAATEVLLYGSVRDADGAPVQLEWLGLEDARFDVRGASRQQPGSYAIAGLTSGEYVLTARAKGFVTLRDTLVLGATVFEHERRDLVLERALSIPIRIVDEQGSPFPDARGSNALALDVVATRAAPREPLTGLSDGAGWLHGCGTYASAQEGAAAPSGCAGVLTLSVAPPVHVSVTLQDAVLATRRVDGPLDELAFTLERSAIETRLGGVRARFVDARTGAPLADGAAALDGPSSMTMGGAELDADAAIELVGRAPGLHTLRFFREGYERFARRVRVVEGRIEDLGEVRVWPAAIVSGTVIDARGRPISAVLRVFSRESLVGPAALGDGIGNAVPGSFELTAPQCPLRLVVSAAGHATASLALDASAGSIEDVEVRLVEGESIAVRASSEWVGAQLTLADTDGIPFETYTLVDGATALCLAPGRYQLWLGEAERVDSVEELVVGEEPLEIDLRGRAR